MTPSMPDRDLDQFVAESGWKPGQGCGSRIPKKDEQVLVFSHDFNINVMDVDGEIYHFRNRDEYVVALASHEGNLFEAWGNGRIFESRLLLQLAERDNPVKSLCSHDGTLCDSGGYCEIYDTIEDRCAHVRSYSPYALASHKGILYEGGNDKSGIVETQSMDLVRSSQCDVLHLCSHGDWLYHTERKKSPPIINTFTNEVITRRKGHIFDLCSIWGKLLDAGDYGGIFGSMEDKVFYGTDEHVHAMCAHPRSYFVEEGILPP